MWTAPLNCHRFDSYQTLSAADRRSDFLVSCLTWLTFTSGTRPSVQGARRRSVLCVHVTVSSLLTELPGFHQVKHRRESYSTESKSTTMKTYSATSQTFTKYSQLLYFKALKPQSSLIQVQISTFNLSFWFGLYICIDAPYWSKPGYCNWISLLADLEAGDGNSASL